MSKRTLHHALIFGCYPGLTIVAHLALSGCGATEPRSPNAPDCSAEDDYEFSTPLLDAEEGSQNHPLTWFGATDNTPNCVAGVIDGVPVGDVTVGSDELPNVASTVCTIQEGPTAVLVDPASPDYAATVKTPVDRALVFHSEGCTYWGSNASHSTPGTPNINPFPGGCQYVPAQKIVQPTGYWNGGAYEGIALWARTPGKSNHAVQLSFNDADTALQGLEGYCYQKREPLARCLPSPGDATAGLGLSVVDYQSGTATAGGVPGRIAGVGECGNGFTTILTTTPDWQLYLLPFSSFVQLPYPNRIASGFDGSTLLQISVIFPREVRTELWITNFRFYRHKGSDAGAD